MSVQSPQAEASTFMLDQFSDPDLSRAECPRRAKIQIDLLLLALEALDLSGSQTMLMLTKELGLEGLIKGRVGLWRLRARCSR